MVSVGGRQCVDRVSEGIEVNRLCVCSMVRHWSSII